MFNGFNDSTINFFELMECKNDKQCFVENSILYEEGIKQPLEQLYWELANYITALDFDLTVNKRRCISSPYNDARFCAGRPIKEYMYVRFKVNQAKKENTLGLFFDASKNKFRYGLTIYDLNARGMESIRKEIIENNKMAKKIIKQSSKSSLFKIVGKKYVKDIYAENAVLKEWLNMRTLSFVHEENVNPVFFERTLLDDMIKTYTEMESIYFFLKKALV